LLRRDCDQGKYRHRAGEQRFPAGYVSSRQVRVAAGREGYMLSYLLAVLAAFGNATSSVTAL